MATSVSEERSTFVEALLVSLSLVSLITHCVNCGSLVGHRYILLFQSFFFCPVIVKCDFFCVHICVVARKIIHFLRGC